VCAFVQYSAVYVMYIVCSTSAQAVVKHVLALLFAQGTSVLLCSSRVL
jgi:hypothetical protein